MIGGKGEYIKYQSKSGSCDYLSRQVSGYMFLSFNQGIKFCSAFSPEATVKLKWASKFWMQENIF